MKTMKQKRNRNKGECDIRKLQHVVVVWSLWFIIGTNVSGQHGTNGSRQHEADELQIDHHVHLLSEALIDDWKSLGMRFSRANDSYADASTVLREVQSPQMVAVSMAHLYASPWFENLPDIVQNERAKIEAEHDFLVSCVRQHPNRMVGMISINPLKSYALEELARVGRLPEILGVKLHLPACGLQLGNPEHLAALRRVFEWCVENERSVLIHVFSGDEPLDWTARFWTLMEDFPSLEIIVAHIGCSGGFGRYGEAILDGWHERVQHQPQFRESPIYFDLSGAILSEETDGLPPTSDEQIKKLALEIQRVGPNKFLLATDYPVFTRQQFDQILTKQLGLSPEQQRAIEQNTTPRLRRHFGSLPHPKP